MTNTRLSRNYFGGSGESGLGIGQEAILGGSGESGLGIGQDAKRGGSGESGLGIGQEASLGGSGESGLGIGQEAGVRFESPKVPQVTVLTTEGGVAGTGDVLSEAPNKALESPKPNITARVFFINIH